MKRALISILSILFFAILLAQPAPDEEIRKNPDLSVSNSVAYSAPVKALTPAPKGKKPFYLSHYGRHGSRYLTKTKDYDSLVYVLGDAAKANKLTPLGLDVLRRAKLLKQEAINRIGDLTPVGAQQHRDIARRMTERFPEIFLKKANIDARSTPVPRCILSMANAIKELVAVNPKLQISVDASYHDMYYLNFQDRKLQSQLKNDSMMAFYLNYERTHINWHSTLSRLFNDMNYVERELDGERINYFLYRLAGSVQNSELRHELTLMDVYSHEELMGNWYASNAWWYLGYGHHPLNGGTQPFIQRNLLRKIIEQADSCITLDQVGAHLRFGHDTMLLPLVCLMEIDNYGYSTTDMDSLVPNGWVNYRVFPMAGNLQLVFYRKDASDKDVLVQVLLNENEVSLPVKSDLKPYYHWSDVRQFFLDKLAQYKE